jgi:hypothetical protein
VGNFGEGERLCEHREPSRARREVQRGVGRVWGGKHPSANDCQHSVEGGPAWSFSMIAAVP